MTTNESAPDPTAGEREAAGCICGAWDNQKLAHSPDCYPATPDADDASTYCGAEFGEVRAGECECPKCASARPDPLQDWPLPGHLKSDASEPLTEAERASIYATVRGYDEDQHPGPIYAEVERIKADAATKARAEGAAQALRDLADDIEPLGYGWASGAQAERFRSRLRDRAARIARGDA